MRPDCDEMPPLIQVLPPFWSGGFSHRVAASPRSFIPRSISAVSMNCGLGFGVVIFLNFMVSITAQRGLAHPIFPAFRKSCTARSWLMCWAMRSKYSYSPGGSMGWLGDSLSEGIAEPSVNAREMYFAPGPQHSSMSRACSKRACACSIFSLCPGCRNFRQSTAVSFECCLYRPNHVLLSRLGGVLDFG